MANTGKLMGKLIVTGRIVLKTGLHIGTSQENMEIGGMVNPVIRIPYQGTLYTRKFPSRQVAQPFGGAHFAIQAHYDIDRFFNKTMKIGGNLIRHHECGEADCNICRLFGASTGAGVTENRPGRLITEDSRMAQESKEQLEAIDTGLDLTEQKWENTLDRITSAANPRQQERMPRGTEFIFKLIYTADVPPEGPLFKSDVKSLFTSLKLLEDDALGGSDPAVTAGSL